MNLEIDKLTQISPCLAIDQNSNTINNIIIMKGNFILEPKIVNDNELIVSKENHM